MHLLLLGQIYDEMHGRKGNSVVVHDPIPFVMIIRAVLIEIGSFDHTQNHLS